MATYFDPIMQQETLLDESTIVYLINIDNNKFSLKTISSGLESLASDPTTHATDYWPIATNLLLKRLDNDILFTDGKLTSTPLTKDQVCEFFAIDPDKTAPQQFNTTIKEELNDEWAEETLRHELNHLPQLIGFFRFPNNTTPAANLISRADLPAAPGFFLFLSPQALDPALLINFIAQLLGDEDNELNSDSEMEEETDNESNSDSEMEVEDTDQELNSESASNSDSETLPDLESESEQEDNNQTWRFNR